MRFLAFVFQRAIGSPRLKNSAFLRAATGLKASTEEIELRKKRRVSPSEEHMLWCWKHRGIW